jgi:hypothetical protein
MLCLTELAGDSEWLGMNIEREPSQAFDPQSGGAGVLETASPPIKTAERQK